MITARNAWRLSAAEVWAPTASEMSALDRSAVDSGRTEERTLIEAAGRELAHRVTAGWPEGPVCGLVGSGHNGADVLVALRTLAAWGRDVRAVQGGSGPPAPEVRAGWPLPLDPIDEFYRTLPTGGVLVDGLLGTGTTGAPREPQAGLIERANSLGLPIVSADLPSGADPTTGAVPGACIRADLTVCFGWPKLGLLRFPARGHAGRIEAVEIGFPPPDETTAGARIITGRWVRRMLRPRPADGHKGTSGYLLLVAGAEGMAGAAVLAARAAYRTGAGIVRIVADPANREIIQRSVPGAVFADWRETDGSAVPASLVGHLEWSHAVAIGPGLGRGDGRRRRVEAILDGRGDRPAVIDADGLNVFEGEPDALGRRLTAADVITPHPGELARLRAGARAEEPLAAARETAERFGCTVVLKGTPTYVTAPGQVARIAVDGGPALAVGGTGDVLTGAIGASLAAGYPALDAASVALMLTGLAAEHTGFGDVGMVAEDVPEAIPAARADLETIEPYAVGSVRFALRAISPREEGR